MNDEFYWDPESREATLKAIGALTIITVILFGFAMMGLTMGGGTVISREICQRQGDAALAADDLRAALGHYDRAIFFDPANAAAIMGRAGIYEQTGQFEFAVGDYERVVDLVGAPSDLVQRAKERLKALATHIP